MIKLEDTIKHLKDIKEDYLNLIEDFDNKIIDDRLEALSYAILICEIYLLKSSIKKKKNKK